MADQHAEHQDGTATGESEAVGAPPARAAAPASPAEDTGTVGQAAGDTRATRDADIGTDPDAPYGRCAHCGDPLPAPLRRGGRRLEYCPDPDKKCRMKHNNTRRSKSRSGVAAVLRSHDQVAAQAAPALTEVARLLTEHAARHQELLDELGGREELEAQIDTLTERNIAVEADARRRIRQALQDADRRVAEAQAQAAREVAAAEQRAQIALARADDAVARAVETQRLADQRVADHDLARGRAEEQAAAAARDTERARQARTDAEQALRDTADRLRAAEEQVARLGEELQTASDERDAHKRHAEQAGQRAEQAEQRAEQAEQRAATTGETLQQTETALADARLRLADAETARDAALTQAGDASTRAQELQARTDQAEQRAERATTRAEEANARADRASERADRLAADADRLRAALHLPSVGDVNGAPGLHAAGTTVTAASGLLHLAGVERPLSPDDAGELARALLAVAAHVPGPGLQEGSDEP